MDGVHYLHRVTTVQADVIVDRQIDLPPAALPARHPHAARGAVERPLVTGTEAAMGANHPTRTYRRLWPFNHDGTDCVAIAGDVVEKAAENAGGVAIRVAARTLT